MASAISDIRNEIDQDYLQQYSGETLSDTFYDRSITAGYNNSETLLVRASLSGNTTKRRDFSYNLEEWAADGIWFFCSNNPTVELVVSGGTGPYSYSWEFINDGNGHYSLIDGEADNIKTITWDNNQKGGGCRVRVTVTDSSDPQLQYTYDISLCVE